MAAINANFLKLKAGYLFPEIARRVKSFSAEHPDAALIRLGIGDVTEPLPQACREAMKAAIDAMWAEMMPPPEYTSGLSASLIISATRCRSSRLARRTGL